MGAGMKALIPISWSLLSFLEAAEVVWFVGVWHWFRQGPVVPEAQMEAGAAEVSFGHHTTLSAVALSGAGVLLATASALSEQQGCR